MQIALDKTLVESLILKRKNTAGRKENKKFSLNYFVKKDAESKNEFSIEFKLKLTDSLNFQLDLVYVAVFTVDEDITDEFMNSNFPKINAPAIAYPYLRSFVSLVTLNSGYGASILPAMNFVKLAGKDME